MVLPPSALSANPVNLFKRAFSVFDGAGKRRLQVQPRRQAVATKAPGWYLGQEPAVRAGDRSTSSHAPGGPLPGGVIVPQNRTDN
jgi:hypothetical protein